MTRSRDITRQTKSLLRCVFLCVHRMQGLTAPCLSRWSQLHFLQVGTFLAPRPVGFVGTFLAPRPAGFVDTSSNPWEKWFSWKTGLALCPNLKQVPANILGGSGRYWPHHTSSADWSGGKMGLVCYNKYWYGMPKIVSTTLMSFSIL